MGLPFMYILPRLLVNDDVRLLVGVHTCLRKM